MPIFRSVGKLENKIPEPGGDQCPNFSSQGKTIAPNSYLTDLGRELCPNFEVEGKLEGKIADPGGEPCQIFYSQDKTTRPNTSLIDSRQKLCPNFEVEGKPDDKIPVPRSEPCSNFFSKEKPQHPNPPPHTQGRSYAQISKFRAVHKTKYPTQGVSHEKIPVPRQNHKPNSSPTDSGQNICLN